MAREITAAWLTDVLRASGALPTGRVRRVEVEPTAAFNSLTVRVRVAYSGDASASRPAAVVVKQNAEADWAVSAGQEEVRFYRRIAQLPDHPGVVVPCLAAGIDESSGDSYLVLTDLTGTHRAPLTRDEQLACGMPRDRDIGLVVDALADLHGYWWQRTDDQLTVGYWTRDEDRLRAYQQRRRESWHRVCSAHDWLPDDVRSFYPNLLGALPAYWCVQLSDRMRERRALTLVHGDAYFANFLCPRGTDRTDTYLLDWQSPTVDIGAGDLVSLFVPFWSAAQRREDDRERDLLARYHRRLCAAGVAGYSIDDLHLDYRRGLIEWVLIPVQDAADGSRLDYWWPKMRRLIDAYREWDCAALLG